MDAKRLDLMNSVVNRNFLKFKKEVDLTFNQYLALIKLYNIELEGRCITYKQIRDGLQFQDLSDFNKTVMKPLKEKGYAYGEQRNAPGEKDAFITESGSELVEKILKFKKPTN